MDEIKRIRNTMATSGPILTDVEKGVIIMRAQAMGMSGKYRMERLLAKIEEEGYGDPVVVMRMVSDYISRLKEQVARYGRS